MSNIAIGDRFIMGYGWLLFIQLQPGPLTLLLHYLIAISLDVRSIETIELLKV
jgi:hypothetical protein